MIINHIGVVVRSLEQSQIFFESNFGYNKKVDKIFVKNQSVNIVILENPKGGPDIELITPVGANSPSFNALRKGLTLNHICYETKNYKKLLKRYQNKIVRPSMPTPIELFGGGNTFFVFMGGMLIEFLERNNDHME